MTRKRPTAAISLLVLAIALAACVADRVSPSPSTHPVEPSGGPTVLASATPTPSATSAVAADIPVRVSATMTERCGSIGGCAAYLIVRADGEPDWPPIPLLGQANGLWPVPSMLAPGKYTFHFSWRAVSDAVSRGQPPQEYILDTCPVDLVAGYVGGRPHPIDVTAVFHGSTCDASSTTLVEIID